MVGFAIYDHFLDSTESLRLHVRKIITSCCFLYVLPSLGDTTWEDISPLLMDDFAEDALFPLWS